VSELKFLKVMFMTAIAVAFVFSFSFAAGNASKGKALFDNPKAFGAPGLKSCSSCHPGGKGLEMAGKRSRKEWTNPAGTWLSIEDASNVCIMMANKGKTIDPRSGDMKDLIAYIRSLAGKK
jgi:mono/diheme cytochrome c family protein